ncbi:MAG TPA: hydroxymethylglutaryl-CoA reductase (NADPH) [Methanomicrobiales archaeon]|nr:hydroxymethylglutaryl-CoA reductase (NADPH) [Methanomicrobiales archaeon]
MDQYLERLKKGTLKLHALEKEVPAPEAIRIRRAFIEQEAGVQLPKIGSFTMDPSVAVTRNIENMVGAVQVPVGVAGPLKVRGEHAGGEFYVPLATTEGALVASVNRGCGAITRAGGADVRILREGMTRAPVFSTRDILHSQEVKDFVDRNLDALAAAAAETTSHGKLTGAMAFVTGTTVHVRLEFDTKDAMGMNMVTIASERISGLIEEKTGAHLVALSGNLCTDKKPAAVNGILGRGKTVVAGVFLPDGLVSEVFKTGAETLAEVNYRKNLLGSARAGSLGFNAQAANIIAALFIACGQDAAHVVEGSGAFTTAERREGGAYVAVTIPALQLGTVGGGTGLDTQRECLSLLGVAGGGTPPGAHARKFAEIAAAAVLAGELSLLGALGAGHLARAHRALGRGNPKGDLDPPGERET